MIPLLDLRLNFTFKIHFPHLCKSATIMEMIGLIVARSKNNVIGKNGQIPWKIEGEQKQFKELTTGNIVIMGRKTYEEIGHPLPNRKTIVVSKSRIFEGENLYTAKSLHEAVKLAEKISTESDSKIFLAGGYAIYKEGLDLADVMYITEVDITVKDGDTFFPDFNKDEFDFSLGETNYGEGNDGSVACEDRKIKYTRTIYKRFFC